jgi:hypothetical protein
MLRLMCVLCIMSFVVGCTEEPVTVDEVVGAWVLSEDSREFLPSELFDAAPAMHFKRNGTFEFVEVPRFEQSGLDYSVELMTCNGGWQLGSGQDAYAVDITIEHVLVGELPGTPYGTGLFFRRSDKGPELYRYRGDPDSNERIRYVRMK